MQPLPAQPEFVTSDSASSVQLPRRHFLGSVTVAIGAALTTTLPASSARSITCRLHLQDCRIAGSHYYDFAAVRARLRIGDALQLRREPDNRHDDRAIEVFWHAHKLGYLPRMDNAAAASLADRANTLHAAVIGIDDPDAAWEPICLRLWVTPT